MVQFIKQWLWLTFFNLVPPDIDIVISIRARLFVVKAQSMEELMLHDGFCVTPGANGHILACSVIPNIWPASEFIQKSFGNTIKQGALTEF